MDFCVPCFLIIFVRLYHCHFNISFVNLYLYTLNNLFCLLNVTNKTCFFCYIYFFICFNFFFLLLLFFI